LIPVFYGALRAAANSLPLPQVHAMPHVFGPNFAAVEAAWRVATPGQLLVITDFDETLTTFDGLDGQPIDQCHELLLRYAEFGAGDMEMHATLIEWQNMPEPKRMEICGQDLVKRKERSMWFFTEFQKISRAACFGRQAPACVAKSNVRLRSGVGTLLAWLEENSVPLIVVSAGIVQVIRAIIAADGRALPSTATVVANDADAEHPTVTSRTKAAALKQVELSPLCERPFVLVLGDKPSDLDVVTGLDPAAQLLKVGFTRPGQDLEPMLVHFDVVLTDDAPMDFVNDLLARVASTGRL